MRLVEPHAEAPLGGRQLRPVVDAVEPAVVVERDRADQAAVLAGERDEVGQVQLSGRGRRLERLDPAPQPGRVEGVDAGVDLVALELFGRGVVRLDDPLDGPEVAAHDPPETRRVGREHAGQRDRRVILATGLEHGVEVGAGHERDVARQHEDLGRLVRNGLECRPDRVSGAARGLLERERAAIDECRDDGLDRWRVDDDRTTRGSAVRGALPGVEDVVEHRTATQPVEDLGRRRAHPGAKPGREHDGDRGRRVGTWGVHEVRRRPGDGRWRRAHRSRSGSGAVASGFIKGPGIVGAARSGCQPSLATTSISTRAPFGRAATPTVDRAGGGSPTNRP